MPVHCIFTELNKRGQQQLITMDTLDACAVTVMPWVPKKAGYDFTTQFWGITLLFPRYYNFVIYLIAVGLSQRVSTVAALWWSAVGTSGEIFAGYIYRETHRCGTHSAICARYAWSLFWNIGLNMSLCKRIFFCNLWKTCSRGKVRALGQKLLGWETYPLWNTSLHLFRSWLHHPTYSLPLTMSFLYLSNALGSVSLC